MKSLLIGAIKSQHLGLEFLTQHLRKPLVEVYKMRTVRKLHQIKGWLNDKELLDRIIIDKSDSEPQVVLVDDSKSPYIVVLWRNTVKLSINFRESSPLKLWVTVVIGQVQTYEDSVIVLQLASLSVSNLNKAARRGVISIMSGDNEEVFVCYHVPIAPLNVLCKQTFTSFLEALVGEVYHLSKIERRTAEDFANQLALEAEFQSDEDDYEDEFDNELDEDGR